MKIEVRGYKYFKMVNDTLYIDRNKEDDNSWTKLKMDGLMSFNIVEKDNGSRDIRICLYTNSDYRKPKLIYVASFLNDVSFDGTCKMGKSFNEYNGLKDKNIFNQVSDGKNIYSEYIAVYKEDFINNIVEQISNKDIFEEVTQELLEGFRYIYPNMNNQPNNFLEFINTSHFDYDIDGEFGIDAIPFTIEYRDGEAYVDQTDIEHYFEAIIDEMCIIKYNRAIDLSKIEKEYALIRDENDILYLFTYVTRTMFCDVPPYEDLDELFDGVGSNVHNNNFLYNTVNNNDDGLPF